MYWMDALHAFVLCVRVCVSVCVVHHAGYFFLLALRQCLGGQMAPRQRSLCNEAAGSPSWRPLK